MTHSYIVEGMTCDHCVNRVTKALEALENVQSAEVTLSPSRAVITMNAHVELNILNATVQEVGDYSLSMAGHAMHGEDNEHHAHKGKVDHAAHKGMDDQYKDHGSHGGSHHDHHRMMIADFKKRFWASLILTIPILLLSPMIQEWLGLKWSFSGDRIVLFGLSSIIYFYGGWPFLKGLTDELAKKSPGMMTLVAIAISAAYIYSSAVVFGLEGKTFFWELATLIVVMLLGHYLEMRSILGASKALEALAALMPDEAHLIVDGKTKNVKVSTLKENEIILIKPGEKVPADGIIVEGSSNLNESMLTGESKPVRKGVDQEVIGGAINGSDILKVRVRGTGEDTYLSKVIRMVQDAQGQKSKTQRLADVAAKWLTVIAIVGGLGTFIIWLMLGKELAFSLERMVTVMVICCPHALGLAIPLVAAISTGISAKNGLLIRNRTAFENSRRITTIVFDKTGTLTKGSHEVVRIIPTNPETSKLDLLRLATAVESPSEHHISKGLQKRAKVDGIEIPPVFDFKYTSGVGVKGFVEGQEIQAGGFLLLEQLGLNAPIDQNEDIETKIFIIVDGKLMGFITFSDVIRESARPAIQTLQQNGIRCSLLTGDNYKVAEYVAKELQMDDFMAEVLPDEKQAKIKELQSEGAFVAMTGDGVNDAPALAQADVGIAIGSGTDVAAETADIVLVDSDPQDITNLILFGKATYRKMVQNLIWATGYNVIAMPLATGFVSGIVITPAIGAALMSASTIICAVNAQLLKYELK